MNNIIEWRQNPALVKAADAIIVSPEFQSMILTIIKDRILNPSTVKDADASRMLGRIEGVSMALTDLQSLGQPLLQPSTLEPTYSTDPINQPESEQV